MLKRQSLIFFAVVGLLVFAAISFIQSQMFAGFVKTFAARHIPDDLGVEGDFSEFAVKLFPPGISVREPRLTVKKSQSVDLPAGSTIRAERIDLNFLPLQMLTGNIRVNEAIIVGGDVNVHFDKEFLDSRQTSPVKKAKNKGMKLALTWDELLKIRIENIGLERTHVHISMDDPSFSADLLADELRVGQWTSRKGGLGYEASIRLSDFRGKFPKAWRVPEYVEQLEAKLRVNILGVQLDQFKVAHQGLTFEASGGVKGNLLKPKNLPADFKIKAEADVAGLVSLFNPDALPASAEKRKGRFRFAGDVKGDLDRPMETLKASGELSGAGISWDGWLAEKLLVQGEWQAAPTGGLVKVNRIQAEAPETERVSDKIPAGGGKFEAGPFEMHLGSLEPVTVPLKLEHAHLHWLLGPSARGVFGLMFRINGQIGAKFTPPGLKKAPWRLQAALDLKVDQFQLDNQRMGMGRVLKRVLKVPEIKLKGAVDVDPVSFKPDGLTITLPHTQFSSSGVLDFKKGADLKFTGPVDLEDIDTIGEKPIRGKGTITTRVQGPAEKLKLIFDAELKSAKYLRLNFGEFRGRVTWDDDPELLLFDGVQLTQGRTVITGGGKIDLSDKSSIDLDLPVSQGTVQDLMFIFEDLTKNVSWLPRGLSGAVAGRVRLSGGVDLTKLKVMSTLTGVNWDFMGERFRKVTLSGGYDRGRYLVDQLEAVKRNGSIQGHIAYDEEREAISWSLNTSGLTLGDFDHIASLDVPVRGSLSVTSRGAGILSKNLTLDMFTEATVSDLKIRGVEMPKSTLLVKGSGTTLSASGNALNGEGLVELGYDYRKGTPSFIKAKLESLDFSPILLLLNSKLIQDPALVGTASGQVDLQFNSGEIEKATGKIELGEYVLAKSGTRFELAQSVGARIEHGTFDLGPVVIRGSQGEARLQLRGRKADLDGTISGDVEVSVAEFFTSSILHSEGTAQLDFTIGGHIKEPSLFGKATIEDATLQIRAVDAPFENVAGVFQLRQNVISIQNLEANLASGRVSAGGSISLFVDRAPKIALQANVREVKLKVPPFQFVRFRGKLAVSGESLPYLVSGEITSDSALAKEKMMNAQAGARALKAARFQPKPVVPGEGDYPLFRLDIGVTAEKGILVQNDLFDAEMKAEVRLVNTFETPRITGRVDLIQGRMNFKEHVFQIQSAEMEFDSPAAINPRFSLIAQAEVSQTKIQLFSTGRLESYKIELSANPTMPEQEILQLLALGATSSDFGKFRPGDRGMVESGGAASLVLHSLDVNRDIKQKTGFQIQIDDAVNTVVGNSIFQPRADSTVSAAPKIVIRRQISRRFDVSMGSTVGLGTTVQREANIEYKLSRGASVLGVWNSIENVDTKNTLGSSFGIDLRLQRRFK